MVGDDRLVTELSAGETEICEKLIADNDEKWFALPDITSENL